LDGIFRRGRLPSWPAGPDTWDRPGLKSASLIENERSVAVARRLPSRIWCRCPDRSIRALLVGRFDEPVLGFHGVSRRPMRKIGNAQMDGGNPGETLIIRVQDSCYGLQART
jgi:hypothetical protein